VQKYDSGLSLDSSTASQPRGVDKILSLKGCGELTLNIIRMAPWSKWYDSGLEIEQRGVLVTYFRV
jgi:hypothetical protein